MSESTTTEVTEISRTQLWHRTRALIKTHEIMDGSGHLYLKNRGEKVTKEQTKAVIAFVHAELAKQGFSEAKAKTMKPLVISMLHSITRRGPEPTPKPKPKPKPTTKPQTEPQTEQTQRKQQKQEVRIVTVTVKKRSFHYPRDLPSGDAS